MKKAKVSNVRTKGNNDFKKKKPGLLKRMGRIMTSKPVIITSSALVVVGAAATYILRTGASE